MTYTLAIAKSVLQIEAEASWFDSIFICFGAFHIPLKYIGCMGHFIDGSGSPRILAEIGVLAMSFLSGFLLGKHYSQYKRLHL